MNMQEVLPFARFVRYLRIREDSIFYRNIPLDSRLFYAVEGTGSIEIGGEKLTIREGSVLYIPAGMVYQIQPGEVTYLAVNFDFSQHYSMLAAPIEPVRDLGQSSQPLEQVAFEDAICFNSWALYPEQYGFYRELEHMEYSYANKLPYYQQELSGRLLALLTRMAQLSAKRVVKAEGFDIEQVMTYIRTHLQEPLDNHTLAKQFHFHPNYISSEFKNAVGQSLHSYVLEARILYAVTLMEAGQRDLSKIAQSCGFSSANYFIRCFKKRMRVTPGVYLRSNKL